MGFLKACFCIPRTIDSEYHGNNYARSDSDSSVQVPITPHPQGVIDSPLVEAADAGEMMKVKTLLRQGEDPNQRGQGDRTALHAAVAKNKRSVALALLEAKADPNLKDQEGCTPLHLAARHSCHDIVPMLLLAGADLTASTKSGQVAMDMAPDTASSVALRRAILIAAEQSGGIKGVEALLKSNTSTAPSPPIKPPPPAKALDTATARDQQARDQPPAPQTDETPVNGQGSDAASSPARTPSPTTPVQAQPKMTPAAALLQRAVAQPAKKAEVSPLADISALLSTPPPGRGSAHAVAAFPEKLNSQTFVMGNNVSAAEAFAEPSPAPSATVASPAPAAAPGSAFGSAAAAAPVAAAAGAVFQEQYQRLAGGADAAPAPAAVAPPAQGNGTFQPAPGAAVTAANGALVTAADGALQALGDANGTANGTANGAPYGAANGAGDGTAYGSSAKKRPAAGPAEGAEEVEGAGQLGGVVRLPAVKAVRRLREEGPAASIPLSPMGQKAHMLVEREMGSAVVQKQLDQAQLTVDERREVTRELAVALRKREMRMSLKADEISATIHRVRLNHVAAEAQQKPPLSDFSRSASQHQQAVAFLSNSIPELKPRTSADSASLSREEEPASPSVATANSAFTDATEGPAAYHSALNTSASTTSSFTSPMPLQAIASIATSPLPPAAPAAAPSTPTPAVPSAAPAPAVPSAAPKEPSTTSTTALFVAPIPPAPTPPTPAPKTSPPSTGPSTPPSATPVPATQPSAGPPSTGSSPPPSFDYDYQPTPPPANASVLTTTSSFSYSTSATFSASPLSTFEPSDVETAPMPSLLSDNLAPISENPVDDTWLTSSDPSYSDPLTATSPSPHTPIDSSDLNLPSIRASPLPKTPTPKTPGTSAASKKYSLRAPKQSLAPAPAPSPTPAKSPAPAKSLAPASTPSSTQKKSVPVIEIPNSTASPEYPSPMTPQPDFVTPTRPHHSPSTLVTPKSAHLSARQEELATPRSRQQKTPATPLSRSMTGGTPLSGTTPRSNSASLSGLYTPRRSGGSQSFRMRGSTTSVTSSTAADDRPPWRY